MGGGGEERVMGRGSRGCGFLGYFTYLTNEIMLMMMLIMMSMSMTLILIMMFDEMKMKMKVNQRMNAI
jgi:hypothetical protein